MTSNLLKLSSLVCLCAVLTACLSLAPRREDARSRTKGAPDEPLEIIDAHVHTDFSNESDEASGIRNSKEEFLREMREAGVVGAVSMGSGRNKEFVDLRSYGVIHCGGVRDEVDVKAIEQGLQSGQYGCIKIYLGYVYRYASDKAYEPIYELAEKYAVPVVFHTGDTESTRGKLKYSDPLTVDEVAVDHPKVTFVLAHCGNPWIESAAEVAYKNPNVYLDGSAFLIGDLKKKPPEAIERYAVQAISWVFGYVENPEKLMFGTDWPLVSIPDYVDMFKRAIPREHWKAVFHDNAFKVFKFSAMRPTR